MNVKNEILILSVLPNSVDLAITMRPLLDDFIELVKSDLQKIKLDRLLELTVYMRDKSIPIICILNNDQYNTVEATQWLNEVTEYIKDLPEDTEYIRGLNKAIDINSGFSDNTRRRYVFHAYRQIEADLVSLTNSRSLANDRLRANVNTLSTRYEVHPGVIRSDILRRVYETPSGRALLDSRRANN